MNALINIGLTRADVGYVHTSDIEDAFNHWGVELHKARVAYSDTDEDTFVAYVSDWNKEKAYGIACALGQDCIAQYDLSQCEGALVGPRAEAWGRFDSSLFKVL